MKRELLEQEYIDSYRQGNSCLTTVVMILFVMLITLLVIGLLI